MLRRMIFPILLGLVGCAVLISLGVWQVNRLAWKEAMLAAIEAKIHDAPVALPASPDPAADKYLPVTVTGQFTGQELFVLAGQKGTSPGVEVIAGFQTQDGRKILVDRGFLHETDRSAPRPAGQTVTLTGNLHWPMETDSYTPPPDEKTGLWFARDVPAMAAELGTEPTMIVANGPVSDGIQPQSVDTSSIPNDHLNYAITWFSLAAVWAGMTVYLLWRIRRRTV